ncbi:hypothetical protein L2E82_30806 [Cichorium intybus]|uniref:Uncharacterized protein n=1 Tax=Cichorium intybus TaxID=13427 RepID=A0ACB9D184_CICIN|nr:hypothetical protein L2E82_30806 [Cichorium intybus]
MDMPRIEGLLDVKLVYVGGMHVLMEFEKLGLADDFLKNAKATWSNWFSNLFKWNHDFVARERLASITIFGVLLQIWNTDVCEEIARIWGKPIGLTNDGNDSSYKEARSVGILTSEAPWINEFVKVNVHGRWYKVKVVEEPSRSRSMVPVHGNQEEKKLSEEEWGTRIPKGDGTIAQRGCSGKETAWEKAQSASKKGNGSGMPQLDFGGPSNGNIGGNDNSAQRRGESAVLEPISCRPETVTMEAQLRVGLERRDISNVNIPCKNPQKL